MNLPDRLRRLAELLPPGASLTLSREWILEATAGAALAEGPLAADLSVEQVAPLFGKSASTVRAWLESGRLRGYKPGGRVWRVTPAAVEAFREREHPDGHPTATPDSADLPGSLRGTVRRTLARRAAS